MTILGYTLSHHLMADREDRMVEILCGGGFGDKIIGRINNPSRACTKQILTSTGVIMVVNEYDKTILTLFKATPFQIKRFILQIKVAQ